jgi:hypothetical protein
MGIYAYWIGPILMDIHRNPTPRIQCFLTIFGIIVIVYPFSHTIQYLKPLFSHLLHTHCPPTHYSLLWFSTNPSDPLLAELQVFLVKARLSSQNLHLLAHSLLCSVLFSVLSLISLYVS